MGVFGIFCYTSPPLPWLGWARSFFFGTRAGDYDCRYGGCKYNISMCGCRLGSHDSEWVSEYRWRRRRREGNFYVLVRLGYEWGLDMMDCCMMIDEWWKMLGWEGKIFVEGRCELSVTGLLHSPFHVWIFIGFVIGWRRQRGWEDNFGKEDG